MHVYICPCGLYKACRATVFVAGIILLRRALEQGHGHIVTAYHARTLSAKHIPEE